MLALLILTTSISSTLLAPGTRLRRSVEERVALGSRSFQTLEPTSFVESRGVT